MCQRHPTSRPVSHHFGYSTSINDERHGSPFSSDCSQVYQSTAKSKLKYQSAPNPRCPPESEPVTRNKVLILYASSSRSEPGATINRNRNDSKTRASKHEKRGRYVFHTRLRIVLVGKLDIVSRWVVFVAIQPNFTQFLAVVYPKFAGQSGRESSGGKMAWCNHELHIR